MEHRAFDLAQRVIEQPLHQKGFRPVTGGAFSLQKSLDLVQTALETYTRDPLFN